AITDATATTATTGTETGTATTGTATTATATAATENRAQYAHAAPRSHAPSRSRRGRPDALGCLAPPAAEAAQVGDAAGARTRPAHRQAGGRRPAGTPAPA